MTDNSAAEKFALKSVWPGATQLLCHFHVAQAEWRWLTATKNHVGHDERRKVMSVFQEIMYADTLEKLEAAKEKLAQLTHSAYVQRIRNFLHTEEEWVLLFRSGLTTRGHNTNNFAEASIRILKDIVLCRTKAFNAAALVDFTASTWEEYFQKRILKFAYNRTASGHLLYHSLLKRMPEDASSMIKKTGNNVYEVPSTKNDSTCYEVITDVGSCTCPAGTQGAFCKHQALVHRTYGGIFPNAPTLSTHDRYNLGKLALGDKCPPLAFFSDLRDTSNDNSNNSTGSELQSLNDDPPQDVPPEPQSQEASLHQLPLPSAPQSNTEILVRE
ncbi:uncharacterized protein LOC135386423 [Ornithodoros turicata]|uniref:uncharacterized protein LOC135386423 n=1 Tax=Ornithodoros turicata TaxID=34597 RepID=UPI003139ECBC